MAYTNMTRIHRHNSSFALAIRKRYVRGYAGQEYNGTALTSIKKKGKREIRGRSKRKSRTQEEKTSVKIQNLSNNQSARTGREAPPWQK